MSGKKTTLFLDSDDPRVLAWQAANNLLSEAAQYEEASPQHTTRVALAQVYATLASVSGDVLTGIQLAQLATHMRQAQAQEKAEEMVSEALHKEGEHVGNNGVNVTGDDDNVIPIR